MSDDQSWKRGPYSRLGLVGLLTPPANTTLEPELTALLPAGLSLHAARLPGRVAEDTAIGLRDRFQGYHDTLAESADSFGGMPLDALVYGVTGSMYLVDAAGERAVLDAMRSAGAAHVNTAAGAIRDVLQAGGAKRIALVTPYPDWLTDAAVAYWRALGIEVSGVVGAREGGSIYAIPPEHVLRAVRSLDLDGVDAIVLSGTGMPTIEPITRLSAELEIPAIASTPSLAWWAAKTLVPEAIATAHPIVAGLEEWTNR